MSIDKILDLNVPLRSRNVRIFLSSTFRDMEAERTQLVTYTFPRLRRLAHERGVEVTEVDLRWGITENEVQTGQVVRLCLNEIRECRKTNLPFFIGLIGGRYGWIPTPEIISQDQRTLEDFPNVSKYLAHLLSVTEMEFLEGILQDGKNGVGHLWREQAWVFRRSSEFTNRLMEKRPEILYRDEDDPMFTDVQKAHMRNRLRILVQQSEAAMIDYHPVYIYGTIEDLDLEVERAFKNFLDTAFPKELINSEPDEAIKELLKKQRISHAEFGQSRIGIYVGGEQYYPKIDSLLEKGRPVLVTGPSGSGKSSLLANWIAHFQKKNPTIPVLYHFCGGGADSTGLNSMLRRLTAELHVHLANEYKFHSEDSKLADAFLVALASIPVSKPLCLVLDALDELDTLNDICWLPPAICNQLKVLVSIKSPVDGVKSQYVERFIDRGFECIETRPLNIPEREEIIRRLLLQYGKSLPNEEIKQIAEDKESESPLVLRIFTEELRLFGCHDELSQFVHKYIDTKSPEEFFDKVLERIEADFPHASDVLSLIGISHTGLSESEILDLMNHGDSDYKHFSKLAWAALHESLRPHVQMQNGCLQWFHDLIRTVVKKRYLSDKKKANEFRQRLVDYFLNEKRKLSNHGLQEWPWLLRQLGDKKQLETAFNDSAVQAALIITIDSAELHRYWLWLAESNGGIDWIAERLMECSEGMNLVQLKLLHIYFSEYVGRPSYQIVLAKRIINEVNATCDEDDPDTIDAKVYLADSHSDKGDHTEALKLRKEIVSTRLRLLGANHKDTISAKDRLAHSYMQLNCLTEVQTLMEEVHSARVQIFGIDHIATNSAKANLANCYSHLGRHEDALVLRKQVLSFFKRNLGLHYIDSIAAKNNLAASYSDLGHHMDALALREDVYSSRLKIFGEDHSETIKSKEALANSYSDLGRYADALVLHEEVLSSITRILGSNHTDTIEAKANLAKSCLNSGRYSDALTLLESVYSFRLKLLGPDCKDTTWAKAGIANAYSFAGRHLEALELREDVYSFYLKNSGTEHPDTITAKANLANSYVTLGRRSEGLILIKEAYSSFIQIYGEDHTDTISAKNNLALLYSDLGRYDEALKLKKEVYSSRLRIIGADHPDTISAKNSLALSFFNTKRYNEAIRLSKEALLSLMRIYGTDHPDTNSARLVLASSFTRLKKYKEAHCLWEDLYNSNIHLYGSCHSKSMSVAEDLALSFLKLKKKRDAEKLYDTILQYLGKCIKEDFAEFLKNPVNENCLKNLTDNILSEIIVLEKIKRFNDANDRIINYRFEINKTFDSIGWNQKALESRCRLFMIYIQLFRKKYFFFISFFYVFLAYLNELPILADIFFKNKLEMTDELRDAFQQNKLFIYLFMKFNF